YIIVRHQDREHPHVHIVFNRIDNNGKTISDRNDMYRNEQVCMTMSIEISPKSFFEQPSVADMRLIACPGAEELTGLIDKHLVRW
ncbi:relaxase/mobilization nuclease domain-containing protein, partial [Escherichia coli]|nr:relaxase/mobilization nuclease domain-containing protein [Escherichia coli]